MKFAAFGRSQILYHSIRACQQAGHTLALLGTCSAAPEYTKKEKDFEILAAETGCPFFCSPSINRPEIIQLAKKTGVEVAISFNWLTLIGQKMIDCFSEGILNAHPGDLPRYRGNACPNWAILAGESQVVVSIHQMTVDLDSGPILLQRALPLQENTYIGAVYDFLENHIPQMFAETLNGFTSGTIKPHPQPADPALSLRVFPRLPCDSEIDWQKPATFLDRLVRASAEPFSGAFSHIGLEKIIIWRAHAAQLPYPWMGTPGQVAGINRRSGEVSILTGQDVLVIEEVETVSTGRVPAATLITSARTRLGIDYAHEIAALQKRLCELETILASSTHD